MMNRTTCFALIATLLTWSGAATAALEPLEESTEVSVNQTQLPVNSASHVVIRRSGNREPLIWSVDGLTTYYIGFGTGAVSLKELRHAVRIRQGEMLLVAVSTETGKVSRIVLDVPTQ